MWYDLTEKQEEATAGFKVMEKKLQEVGKTKAKDSPTKASPLKQGKRLVKHDQENDND